MRLRPLREAARVELLLLLRDPVTLVFAVVMPMVFILVLGGVFGDTPDGSGGVFRGVGGSTFYTPAYVGLVAASIGLVILPTHMAGYRERGVLRRIRASGFPVSALLLGQVAVALALFAVGAVLVTGLSFAVYDPDPAGDVLGVAVAAVVGAIAFALLGLALGALLPTARAAQGAGVLLWFVVLILGGAGPPPAVLPDAMGTVGDYTPLRPLVIALQDPWFMDSWNLSRLGALAALGAGAWLVAALRLRRD